jgi:S-methyl-5-thioribose kinase
VSLRVCSVLRDVQLQYVFTKCYNESEKGAAFKADASFMAEVESLKTLYKGEEDMNRALLHGDLHPGSWMINEQEGVAKTIDPEFCIYGPPGLDVGSLLSGIALAGVYHTMRGDETGVVDRLAAVTERIWESYAQTMEDSGIAADVTAKVGVDAVGFACCEVARTALGFAGDRVWLKFDDAAKSSKAEDMALALTKKCMAGRREGGVGFLAAAIRGLA